MHDSCHLIEWGRCSNWFWWSEIWKIFIMSAEEREAEDDCSIESVDLYTNRRLVTYKGSALICIPEEWLASLYKELCTATNCWCENSAVAVKASYYSWFVDGLAKMTFRNLECTRGVNLSHFLKGWAFNGLGKLATIDVIIAELETEAVLGWVIDYGIGSRIHVLCWLLLLFLYIKWGWVYSTMQ